MKRHDECHAALIRGQEERRSRGDPARAASDLRQQNDPEAPGNGRAGGPGELAGPSGEVVGLMGCKEGNRPLLPYPRASLTTSGPSQRTAFPGDFAEFL